MLGVTASRIFYFIYKTTMSGETSDDRMDDLKFPISIRLIFIEVVRDVEKQIHVYRLTRSFLNGFLNRMSLLRYFLVSEKNNELFPLTFFTRNDGFDVRSGFSFASNRCPDRVRLALQLRSKT